VKDRIGLGHWFRFNHELVLVGSRGNIPAPAPGTQWNSVFDADRRGHSVKPDALHEMIEALFPSLPKLEMNARAARAGWDIWGAEAPEGVS
jgi:N6-adenosine-specific RNA methylase IME4